MVPGRGSRSENEQQSAEHQAPCGGKLSVEAALQHRGRSRELGSQVSRVEPGGPVDEEDHGEAEEAESEDDPAEPVAPGPGRDQGNRRGDHADRDQEIIVRSTGGFEVEERRRGGREACVAGLPDLDPVVVDELGGDEESA